MARAAFVLHPLACTLLNLVWPRLYLALDLVRVVICLLLACASPLGCERFSLGLKRGSPAPPGRWRAGLFLEPLQEISHALRIRPRFASAISSGRGLLHAGAVFDEAAPALASPAVCRNSLGAPESENAVQGLFLVALPFRGVGVGFEEPHLRLML